MNEKENPAVIWGDGELYYAAYPSGDYGDFDYFEVVVWTDWTDLNHPMIYWEGSLRRCDTIDGYAGMYVQRDGRYIRVRGNPFKPTQEESRELMMSMGLDYEEELAKLAEEMEEFKHMSPEMRAAVIAAAASCRTVEFIYRTPETPTDDCTLAPRRSADDPQPCHDRHWICICPMQTGCRARREKSSMWRNG